MQSFYIRGSTLKICNCVLNAEAFSIFLTVFAQFPSSSVGTITNRPFQNSAKSDGSFVNDPYKMRCRTESVGDDLPGVPLFKNLYVFPSSVVGERIALPLFNSVQSSVFACRAVGLPQPLSISAHFPSSAAGAIINRPFLGKPTSFFPIIHRNTNKNKAAPNKKFDLS